MARRRARKFLLPTVWLDWTPAVATMFALVPTAWSPPQKVRVTGGLRHSTWTARFLTPDGHYTRATVRLVPDLAAEQDAA